MEQTWPVPERVAAIILQNRRAARELDLNLAVFMQGVRAMIPDLPEGALLDPERMCFVIPPASNGNGAVPAREMVAAADGR